MHPARGSIAHLDDAFAGNRRQQPNRERFANIDIFAEGAGHDQSVKLLCFHSRLGQEQVEAGADSPFGQLHGAHIVLGEHHRQRPGMSFAGQYEFQLAVVLTHQWVRRREPATRIDYARPVQFGKHRQGPRAADANRLSIANNVKPQICVLDPYSLDRSASRLHAAGQRAAFQRRTGGARGAGEAAIHKQRDFGIGANVDERPVAGRGRDQGFQ